MPQEGSLFPHLTVMDNIGFGLPSRQRRGPRTSELLVPAPDAMRLSVPKAYVSLAPGLEPSAEVARSILAFGRERLAPYKRVRRVEFTELPKTISGKIRRVELRGQENERAGDGTAPVRDPDGIGGPFRTEPSPRGTTEFWEEDFSW